MARTTTKDIANLAGVSQSTVSFVLNDKKIMSISQETRDKVLQAAGQLGYVRRPNLKQPARQQIIGLMIPTLSNLYYPFLTQNIQMYARTKGISIIIMNTMRDTDYERFLVQYLEQYPIDGILCAFTPQSALPVKVPMVIVSEKQRDVTIDTVSLNSLAAGRMMAEHITALGHTRIAYISGPLTHITMARQYRLEGIQTHLATLRLDKYLTTLIDEHEYEALDAAYEYTVGRRATEQILSHRLDISAIIAVNDMTAAGVYSALLEARIKIPEQIAVGGFDNLLLAQIMQPKLTTIDQLAFHGCKLGLDILLDKIANRPSARQPIRVEYEPQLIVRGSTQPGR
jgi:LacI family transcriptional regulator